MPKLIIITGKEWLKGKKPYFIADTPAKYKGLFIDLDEVFEEDGIFKTSEAAIKKAEENKKKYEAFKGQKNDQQIATAPSLDISELLDQNAQIIELLSSLVEQGRVRNTILTAIKTGEDLSDIEDNDFLEEDDDLDEEFPEEEKPKSKPKPKKKTVKKKTKVKM